MSEFVIILPDERKIELNSDTDYNDIFRTFGRFARELHTKINMADVPSQEDVDRAQFLADMWNTNQETFDRLDKKRLRSEKQPALNALSSIVQQCGLLLTKGQDPDENNDHHS